MFASVNVIKPMKPFVIYSDLDGTLLDHYTYEFAAATSALQSLSTLSIPCVINTSKTFAELIPLRKKMQHQDPFIVENGAAVYIPKTSPLNHLETLEDKGDYWCKSFGPNRHALVQVLSQFKNRFQFTGFSELSVDDIIGLTELDQSSALLAMEREFTEPLVWRDSDKALQTLHTLLQPAGLQTQRGGRFVHVMGSHCDKAHAMQWLTEQYQAHFQEPITTMALGDGENDLGMLAIADIPVVIRSPSHEPPQVPNRTDAWLTDSFGPVGWSEAIDKVLLQRGII